jgi:hypothetical protein
VPPPTRGRLPDDPLQLPEGGVVAGVELLHHLERPPPWQHVEPDQLVAHPVGQLPVPGPGQAGDHVVEQGVGPTDQLVELVEGAAGPLHPLQGLGQRPGRLDLGVGGSGWAGVRIVERLVRHG